MKAVIGLFQVYSTFYYRVYILFIVTDDRVLATVKPLVDSFRNLYPINRITKDASGRPLSPAVGRYQEDTYSGTNNENMKGNPWFLTTAAVAELLYKASHKFEQKGLIAITSRNFVFFKEFLGVDGVKVGDVYTKSSPLYQKIQDQFLQVGDSYIRRIMFHSKDGRLPEEFRKDTGEAWGAKDLTWSYASILTAADARNFITN